MRRGHPGIGGWRNENHRHFRPRGGGTPHFRPSRGYGHLDTIRFPPPGSRSLLGPPPFSHHGPKDEPEHYERNKYRSGNRYNQPQRPYEKSYYGPGQINSLYHRVRHSDMPENNSYNETSTYYDKNVQDQACHINSMGDVDERQPVYKPRQREFNTIKPWANTVPFFEQRSPPKPYYNKQHDNGDLNKLPGHTGHRPPSSDHYGGNPGSASDNSNTFSRSVDDTVDIVRKRLLSRETQHTSDNLPTDQNNDEKQAQQTTCNYINIQQEQPLKKRVQRQKQEAKSNCDKIKNKIVHQLFKMDKDKIHKLMDNPNSSDKFEYAISSLITESQNSYNRHLRSVAEKSLCSSSTEFIHNDNNTIYEDTFMKQMQCILDPQDTVLLEDIKPMVLAELCKVLQLNDFDQMVEDPVSSYPSLEEPPRFDDFSSTVECYPTFSPQSDRGSYFEQNSPQVDVERSEKPLFKSEPNQGCESNTEVQYRPKRLFERRQPRKGDDYISSISCDSNTAASKDRYRQERRSIDKKSSEPEFRSPIPVFHTDSNQFSEEEDPFAELDNQYHVAVDPSFIISDEFSCQSQPVANNTTPREVANKPHTEGNAKTPDKPPYDKNPDQKTQDIKTPDESLYKVVKESDTQLPHIVTLPQKFAAPIISKTKHEIEHKKSKPFNDEIKQELLIGETDISLKSTTIKQENTVERKVQQQKQPPDPKIVYETTEKSEISSNVIKSSSFSSNTRKRSIDQRPSHRKEKRKKFESNLSETNKQILNKNIIINVNDCAGKSSEKCDAPKSIFNLFFAKENEDESKKNDCAEKGYSDKYVKRKESIRKQRERESEGKKKHDSVSSSHSNLSPSDSSSTSVNCQTPSKTDGKSKLKSIDMFVEQPHKKSNVHHAHRNTAIAPPSGGKTVELKCKPVLQISRKLIRRHTGSQYDIVNPMKETQTEKNCNSRFVQTERKKLVARGVQTDPLSKSKSGSSDTHSKALCVYIPESKSTDTIERMKEIDLEIQVLLQEKFKLYSSMESKESCVNTMQSLGMAVLNVSPFDDTSQDQTGISTLSEEAIVEDFANIPVEEIKKFALESVREENRRLGLEGVQEEQKLIFESIQEESQKLGLESVPEDRHKENIGSNQENNQKPASKNVHKANRKSSIERVQEQKQVQPYMDSVEKENHSASTQKKRQRQKSVYPERKQSASPKSNSTNVKKKLKPPYISLIEQIITDDRPLEDIISLNDLESLPETPRVKAKKKSIKSHQLEVQKPKKKVSKKNTTKGKIKYNLSLYDIKECYVLLLREDLSKYIRPKSELLTVIEISDAPEARVEPDNSIVDDTVLNDIQFDMLDVSEDIIIGDLCEVKTEDKDTSDLSSVTIAEEIILDNSQSSVEEAVSSEVAPTNDECKMYDYSANESLRRDSLTVVGNGDAVLAIECIENQFIAACLDGNVYHFSVDGQMLNTLRGSNLAVTCLTIVKEKYGTTVYTGSLDSRIRYYDLETGLEKGPECNVLSPIQTMDRAWDTIFVGTRTGFVLQFECKNNMLIPVSTVKFSEQSILALRAMKEGPRKVLLVAARSEAVTIKDAQTGLLLRTLEGPKMTVYTILFEDGKVYCGTSSHNIHVFDYTSGSHVGSHEGGKGAVCLRSAGGLLFAGCYDGCVYVYREGEARALAQLRGPSLMLLSLAIVGAKIIAGYKDRSLYIWKIPQSIMQEMVL